MVVVWADGRRVVVLRDFVSVERGLFTINFTSCVESVPACVRWTGVQGDITCTFMFGLVDGILLSWFLGVTHILTDVFAASCS
jgi:hypothetical protein